MSSTGCGGVPNVFAIIFAIFIMFTVLALTIVSIVIWWKICRKAGFSGWLALLLLVPAGNLILGVALAFMDWPVLRELRALKQAQATGGQEPGA
jgi:uncharacterized membrane protein YhaH (DUF805 family)